MTGTVLWRASDLDIIDRDGEHADRGVLSVLERDGYIVERKGHFILTSRGHAELRRWKATL